MGSSGQWPSFWSSTTTASSTSSATRLPLTLDSTTTLPVRDLISSSALGRTQTSVFSRFFSWTKTSAGYRFSEMGSGIVSHLCVTMPCWLT
uniref:Uncharacterized protein n=1 Tax=Arundo donax TaxID=35708 RepID=A0A0A9G3L8_ARUDO